MSNLWPDLSNIESVPTPKDILEEQAKYLSEITNGKLYGYIEQETQRRDENEIVYNIRGFVYKFNIKGKYLKNYNYTVFSIHHDIGIYPLRINVDYDLGMELKDTLDFDNLDVELEEDGMDEFSIWDVGNEDKLKELIAQILRSKRVRNIIASIMSLSK